MANPMTSGQFVRLLDKKLMDVSHNTIEELNQRDSMIPKLYRQLPSDSAWEEFWSVGALPDVPEFTGKIEFLSMSPGYHIKIEPKEYAGGIMFERKLLDDKKYDVFSDRAGELAISAHRVQEKIAVRPLAYAHSSAFDYMQSEEGVALCSTSHTTKSGTSTTNGFSNSGTSALSKTSVASTRLLMRKFRNDISERIVIEPDTLIVPSNLYDTAMEITGSEKDPTSANNTINVQYGKWKVIEIPRLDDTDSNNWMMVDSRLMKKFLVWINRVSPEPKNTIDFMTYTIMHAIYFRVGNGFLDWRWIYGQNVT